MRMKMIDDYVKIEIRVLCQIMASMIHSTIGCIVPESEHERVSLWVRTQASSDNEVEASAILPKSRHLARRATDTPEIISRV